MLRLGDALHEKHITHKKVCRNFCASCDFLRSFCDFLSFFYRSVLLLFHKVSGIFPSDRLLGFAVALAFKKLTAVRLYSL